MTRDELIDSVVGDTVRELLNRIQEAARLLPYKGGGATEGVRDDLKFAHDCFHALRQALAESPEFKHLRDSAN